MTAAELQLWRARMGWTREKSAKELGVARGTFDNWIYGQFNVPGPVEVLTKLLEDQS